MRPPSRSEPRPLVIGEAPNRTGLATSPVDGRAGARLANLGGVTVEEFRRLFVRANVLASWPGAGARKGSRFPVAKARHGAARLSRRFVGGRLVILLGHRVAAAFGVTDAYLEPLRIVGRACVVVVVPHPSGVNRWYNDDANVVRARRFMSYAVRRARRGL
jgi:hypothetical protein